MTHQTNACSFAWAVTDGSVHPAMPGRMSSGGQGQDWSALLSLRGLCQPQHDRNMLFSSEQAAQSTASLLFVSPAPSWLSLALSGEGNPWNPKAMGWRELDTPLHTKLPQSAGQLPRAGKPPYSTRGMLLRVLPAPGANSSSFLLGSKEAEQELLAKGGNVLKPNKTTVRPSLTASHPCYSYYVTFGAIYLIKSSTIPWSHSYDWTSAGGMLHPIPRATVTSLATLEIPWSACTLALWTTAAGGQLEILVSGEGGHRVGMQPDSHPLCVMQALPLQLLLPSCNRAILMSVTCPFECRL